MYDAGEQLIIVRHPERWDHTIAVILELLRVRVVMLRREDLDGHADLVDLLLGQPRRMPGGDAIHEAVPLGAELEHGPAAEAESDHAHLLVLGP